MLRNLRNSRFINFFYGLMAFYMLNICIDMPDLTPRHMPEDLSFNDQESLIELIVEKVLGYEDAIPEYDDSDPNQDTTIKSNVGVDHFVLPAFKSKLNCQDSNNKNLSNSIYFLYFPAHYLEVHSPPPEA